MSRRSSWQHAAAAAEKELLALEARLQREATERSAARRAALEAAEAHVQQLRREAEMAAAAKLSVLVELLDPILPKVTL